MDAVLVLEFNVDPARTDEFLAMLRGVQQTLPGSDGCKEIQILQAIDEPTQVTLVERWTSVDSHKAHFDAIVASGDWASVRAMLASDPRAVYHKDH